MRHVYTAVSDWDAQMVRDLLITNGIDAIVEARSSLYTAGQDRVLILNDADEVRAIDIVRDFDVTLAGQPPDTGVVWTWRCPKCREEVEPQFDLCWNCGTAKPQT